MDFSSTFEALPPPAQAGISYVNFKYEEVLKVPKEELKSQLAGLCSQKGIKVFFGVLQPSPYQGIALFFAQNAPDSDLLEFLEQVVGLELQNPQDEQQAETLYFLLTKKTPPIPKDDLLKLCGEYFTFASMASQLVDDITENMFSEDVMHF